MQQNSRGFTLVEALVTLVIVLLTMAGLASLLIESSRINRTEQLTAEVQSNARNCLAMIVQKVRSAGWDPADAGIAFVTLDPDLSDSVSELEIFADLDADGATTGQNEQVLIRHQNGQVVMRPTSDVTDPFVVVAFDISNDEDGDGNIEPMFVPDDTTNPTRILVQVTARSSSPDPTTREFITHTMRTEVVLRAAL
jgi:type II secretory pathway pseudopilin PulG